MITNKCDMPNLEQLKLIVTLKPKSTPDLKPVCRTLTRCQTPYPLDHTTICVMDVIGLE